MAGVGGGASSDPRRSSQEGATQKVSTTFICRPRPKSGLDCLAYGTFARQRACNRLSLGLDSVCTLHTRTPRGAPHLHSDGVPIGTPSELHSSAANSLGLGLGPRVCSSGFRVQGAMVAGTVVFVPNSLDSTEGPSSVIPCWLLEPFTRSWSHFQLLCWWGPVLAGTGGGRQGRQRGGGARIERQRLNRPLAIRHRHRHQAIFGNVIKGRG